MRQVGIPFLYRSSQTLIFLIFVINITHFVCPSCLLTFVKVMRCRCIYPCLLCLGTVNSSLDLPEEEWDNTVRTNLTGSWLVSKHVGMRMRDGKRGGSIINITSIASLNRGQLPGGAAYVASKTGLGAITRVITLTCFKLIIIYLANKGEFFKFNIYIS